MTVLDAPRVKLLIAGGSWPAAPQSGVPTYPAKLARLLDGREATACGSCGRALPGDPADGWATCEPCEKGVLAHGSRWPRFAALDRLRRQPGDGPAVARVMARSHRALEAPSWREVSGAAPDRPIKAWSTLDLKVPQDRLVSLSGVSMWPGVTVRGETVPTRMAGRPMRRLHIELVDGWTWPTWTDVALAALSEARHVEAASAIVSPLDVWPELAFEACCWCGLAEARRDSWLLVDGKPWCGLPSDCPRPSMVAAHNRAAAVFMLTDKPADLQLVDRLYRAGKLPQALLWLDLPPGERIAWDASWGWWDDAMVDELTAVLEAAAAPNDQRVADGLSAGQRDRAAAERAAEARAAERAEDRAAVLAELNRAQPAAEGTEQAPRTLAEAIAVELARSAGEIGEAASTVAGRRILERRRANRARKAGR